MNPDTSLIVWLGGVLVLSLCFIGWHLVKGTALKNETHKAHLDLIVSLYDVVGSKESKLLGIKIWITAALKSPDPKLDRQALLEILEIINFNPDEPTEPTTEQPAA